MRGFVRCAAAVLAASVLAGPAVAQELSTGLSGVSVDVGPLLALGGGLPAQAVRDDLLAALRTSFADRLGRSGPALVVRVTGVSLNPYAGSQAGFGGRGSGTQSDYLDGEALLVARDGRILARHPQLSALPASSGGAWYDPASERRRVTAISEHYAQWLRRTLPSD